MANTNFLFVNPLTFRWHGFNSLELKAEMSFSDQFFYLVTFPLPSLEMSNFNQTKSRQILPKKIYNAQNTLRRGVFQVCWIKGHILSSLPLLLCPEEDHSSEIGCPILQIQRNSSKIGGYNLWYEKQNNFKFICTMTTGARERVCACLWNMWNYIESTRKWIFSSENQCIFFFIECGYDPKLGLFDFFYCQ